MSIVVKILIPLGILLVANPWILCQEPPSFPTLDLPPISNPVVTEMPAAGLLGDLACDLDGNIYVRPGTPLNPKESLLSLPVVRISRTGKVSQFGSKTIEGLPRDAEILRFGIGADGRLHQIIHTIEKRKDALYLVSFSSEGQPASKSSFGESDWMPQLFLPLPSGDFFITGTKLSPEGKPGSTFAGIFGADAQLKRAVRPESASEITGDETFRFAINNVRLADDGNIYLLRASPRPTVKVLNQTGEAVRDLVLQPPLPKASAGNFYVAQRRFLVIFRSPAEKDLPRATRYALYDSDTGELRASYDPGPRRPILACFTGKEIIELSPKSGYFAIGTTELK